MIQIDANHLLMIEPRGARSPEPIIDDITRKMAGALAAAVPSEYASRGCHRCTGAGCQAHSDNLDWYVATTLGGPMQNRPAKLETNSLAVHYLAYHRDDVPASQLQAIGILAAEPLEPTAEQLQ